MPVAEVNDIQIAYEMYGDGEPLILIHGFGYNKSAWIAQIHDLSNYFKVIMIDVRGSGESSHPEESFTIDTLVEDLKGLMDVLKIEKAHLMGWSMGSMIIQNFVLKYPERAKKLVLIGTNAGFPTKDGILMLRDSLIKIYDVRKNDPEAAFFQLARFVFSPKFRKKMEKNPTEKIHGIITPEELIEESTKNQTTPKDLKHLADIIGAHNTLDKLNEIKNETLVIVGTKDTLTPVISNKQIHENLPNSKLEVIEGAGHKVFFENQPEVNPIIIDFLKS
jgi:proline-specific peptidase